MNIIQSSLPIIRGPCFERGNPTRECVELGGRRGVARIHRLNVVEEHWKRDSIVEGVMKDDDKVVSAGGYVAEMDRRAVKCVLGVKLKAMNEILRRILDRFPLLGGPLEVRGRMDNLCPKTKFS